MHPCALCKMIAKRPPDDAVSWVYEDELAVVLVDAAPSQRRHALVVPRVHCAALEDLGERTSVHLLKLGLRAARSLGVSPEDTLQVLLEGPSEGEGNHVHVRVSAREREPAPRE